MTSVIPPAPPFEPCQFCLNQQHCCGRRVCAFEESYPEVYGPEDPVRLPSASDVAPRREDEPKAD